MNRGRTAAVVTPSERSAEAARAVLRCQVLAAPGIVDAEVFRPRSSDAVREEWVERMSRDALTIYERVRRKHDDALAAVDGTIDRAAGRIGSDLHCSACFMAVTANDAIQVLSHKRIMQCKSCVRILYVA